MTPITTAAQLGKRVGADDVAMMLAIQTGKEAEWLAQAIRDYGESNVIGRHPSRPGVERAGEAYIRIVGRTLDGKKVKAKGVKK